MSMSSAARRRARSCSCASDTGEGRASSTALTSVREIASPLTRAATELLTVAVCHFDIFGRLAKVPRKIRELARDLALQDRPAIVLITALRAMGLLCENSDRQLKLTDLAREHLLPGGTFDVGAYIGL